MSSHTPSETKSPPPTNPKRQKRRPRFSIKLDRVNPRDFRRFNMVFACEQCSHFDASKRHCSMGYRPQHQREHQLALYNLTGSMAFCRFLEID